MNQNGYTNDGHDVALTSDLSLVRYARTVGDSRSPDTVPRTHPLGSACVDRIPLWSALVVSAAGGAKLAAFCPHHPIMVYKVKYYRSELALLSISGTQKASSNVFMTDQVRNRSEWKRHPAPASINAAAQHAAKTGL